METLWEDLSTAYAGLWAAWSYHFPEGGLAEGSGWGGALRGHRAVVVPTAVNQPLSGLPGWRCSAPDVIAWRCGETVLQAHRRAGPEVVRS